VLSSDLAETMPQLSILNGDNLGWMALGAPVLTYQSAAEPL
jgi:hypothetical protein